jgi:hypothetical protein
LRPGGNATGINFFVAEVFVAEVATKRLGLLRDLVPKAIRVAVLVNPANAPTAKATLRDIPEAARVLGRASSHDRHSDRDGRGRRSIRRRTRKELGAAGRQRDRL